MSSVISRSRARPRARAASGEARAARLAADGRVEVVVGLADGVTRLVDLYQQTPLRLLCPRVEADEPLTGVLVNTAGGVVGGDRQRVSVVCTAGSEILITGQAAEKVYRSLGRCAHIEVDLRLHGGACLELLPQGTIVFDSAMLRRRTTVRRDAGSKLLAGEILVLGRLGMGERFRRGLLDDRWVIEDSGRLAWIDALHLEGDFDRLADSPAGLGGATALATVIYVADDAALRLDEARELLADGVSGVRAGATVLGNVLVCRWLGVEPHRLRAFVGAFWRAFRASALARPAKLPVLWHS